MKKNEEKIYVLELNEELRTRTKEAKKQGLSYRTIASNIEVSVAGLSKWINGKFNFKIENLELLDAYLAKFNL